MSVVPKVNVLAVMGRVIESATHMVEASKGDIRAVLYQADVIAARDAVAEMIRALDDIGALSMARRVGGPDPMDLHEHRGLYIKWSDAPEWANWFARDFHTQCFWYENKPVAGGNQWIQDGGRYMRAFSRLAWRETLTHRPAIMRESHE